jgi:cytochrome c oxidase subunit 2
MKRLGVWILIIILFLLLAACGSNQASQASQTPAESAKPTKGTTPTSAAPPATGPVEIKIKAKNFEFEPKEIHVKKGDKVKLTLENSEGAHGFAIPEYRLDLKQPGTVEFVADKAGTFSFSCSVVCGAGHSKMTGQLIVD